MIVSVIPLEDVWGEYKKSPKSEAKQRLITEYAHLVKYVAGRICVNLPSHIDINDLMNDGIIGLIDSIEKFDPGRGFKFETYAITRIHGAIMDALRKLDWAPRSLRKKAREMEHVYQRLENDLGRSATEEETAKEMGISQEELRSQLSQMACAAVVSLEEMLAQDDGDVSRKDSVLDPQAGPEETVSQEELKQALAQAITNLPPREKLVITLYYYEGLTLKEITKTLQVSEARASQLHAQAVFRIRGRLSTFLPAGRPVQVSTRHLKKAPGAA